jgi:hypothetical protein
MNRFPSVQNGNLYYVSDRSGVENVYEMVKGGGVPQSVTNVITSVNLPVVGADGSLYGSVLTSDGYEIAKFVDVHPKMMTDEKINNRAAPASLEEALKAPTLSVKPETAEDYSPWSSLLPRQWAPVSLLTYNSNSGVSLIGTLLGFDTTGKHQYFGYAGYNFKPGTVDGMFSYTYYGFRPVITLAASTVTTDIATDINHSQYRNSSQVVMNLSFPIRYTYSALTPSLYGFVNWYRVYDLNSKAQLPGDDFEYSKPLVPGLGASLKFSDAQTTKLGYMSESGNDFTIAAEDRINTNEYSLIKYLARYSHYFDLGEHHVLVPSGRFLGSTYPVGYNSYARAQGPDTTDIYDRGTGVHLDKIELRGYDYYPYLPTRKTIVGSLDYHFPLLKVFRGMGHTAPFFLNQFHGFIYGETAYIPSSRVKNLFLPSFGGGISADTQLFIRIPLTINLEVQNGTRKDYGGDTLFFVSFQGGSLF